MCDNWNHKDEWRQRGEHFLVSVSRHVRDYTPTYNTGEGPHRWAVYAYVYPDHPHFAKFDGTHIWQDATAELPGHSYCSYCKAHYDQDHNITSYQVGWDYHHIHDERFTHMETANDAREVFRDAQELYDWLENYTTGVDIRDAQCHTI